MARQLPLGIRLDNGTTFTGFWAGPNAEVHQHLLEYLTHGRSGVIYLWGDSGVGKTHLLQAAGHATAEQARTIAYLPLQKKHQFTPEALHGWETLDVVCVDDIENITGDAQWETAVFNLFNAMRENKKLLIVTASSAPAGLDFKLADLRSRLGWDLVLQLKPLNDDGKIAALKLRAEQRGLRLPKQTALYLLNRYQRDMHSLIELFDELDKASLAEQRKLTIPFVKSVLTN
ncbi:MAG: DnaA regulatory inactivator Hda [Gammaproteobacteria bacterium]|nr:DnaA regulatory inactivator Hda [Gammaproteobacteria bacterium]